MIAIATNNLSKHFDNFIAVNKINLVIPEGSIYGFLGPNGSGKSTTIRMLCGALPVTSGNATILGHDINDKNIYKNLIGYMSQKFSLYDDLSVEENLQFYAGMYSLTPEKIHQRIPEVIALAKVGIFRHELVKNLSAGWRQRVSLASAILHEPKILFLDEPTSGVDPKARRMFWDIIYDLAEQGTTILITTHFMDEAEHCDYIAIIYQGNLLASDSPINLKKSIQGTLLEISCLDPNSLLEELSKKYDRHILHDAYVRGKNLRVLAEPNLIDILATQYPVKKISPTLEDAFVYFVKNS